MTAQERLRDAISGERRDWHLVEVRPDDIAALLDPCEFVLDMDADEDGPYALICGDIAVDDEDGPRCERHVGMDF